jgi:hypothetical protein
VPDPVSQCRFFGPFARETGYTNLISQPTP